MSNLPVPASQSDVVEGLEDVTSDDLVMPRLVIDHKKGKYVDSLSAEEFDSLEVVMLGLVKQRILWPAEIGENKEAPLCRSYEFEFGHPDPTNTARFPWKASGFSLADYQDDAPQLPCNSCKLQEWGSHPKLDRPWCAEQHVFVIMQPAGESWTPSILTLQSTGIKPSKAYITSFQRSRSPLFTVTTHLSLSLQRRGTVEYAVPILGRGRPTDEADHPEFIENYRRIRQFLQTPRVEVTGTEDETPVTVTATPTKPAPAATVEDDDLPF